VIILLSGMLAGAARQGGATWAVLQYVLGLRRLGHDVWVFEPAASLDPESVGYFTEIVQRFELAERAALLRAGTRETVAVPYDDLRDVASRADVLINISGMLRDPELVASVPRRVYLDLDPAFNQLWAAQGIDVGLAGHTHFVTVGQAVGRPDCTVPMLGLEWIPTLPPVVLDHWPRAGAVELDAFTTVGNWRSYGSIEHDGVCYGQKAHSVRAILDLPARVSVRIEVALDIHPGEVRDLAALAESGWKVIDPREVAGTPDAYMHFVQRSLAELGIAKSGYVTSKCGWFSDRSACYLASGRPVLAQDTGLADFLPTGDGLLTFSTSESAAAGVEEIVAHYEHHAQAARALAEEHFDSDRVLTRLLARVDAAS
jgi:hypothetical protein